MKSRRLNTLPEIKGISNNSVKSRTKSEKSDNPTPRQFDQFLPWLCQQMHICPNVSVDRITKGELTCFGSRGPRLSRSKSKSKVSSSALPCSSALDFTKVPDQSGSSLSTSYSNSINGNTITIRTFYNSCCQLIELAIVDCPVKINRKVIQAINVCIPFHAHLKKFKVNGSGLTESVLYEIGKLLPHSNITDVCLDDTYVPEGNYYVLLDKLSHLQNMSLRRCKINDDVCKKIAEKINNDMPASKILMTLDLTSNDITNMGAVYLGCMLRRNRTLLYLNLADNLLDDVGASHILKPLMIFSLTENELYELRKRKMSYAAKKLEASEKHEQDLLEQMKIEEDKENHLPQKSRKSIRRSKPLTALNNITVKEQAEQHTVENFAKFVDVFDDDNVVNKNGNLNSLGNLRLCYLNLAFNHLTNFSLKKLCEVLKYQSNIKKADCKGLLRVVLDGNTLPVHCELLTTIETYLENAVAKHSLHTRTRSFANISKKYVRK